MLSLVRAGSLVIEFVNQPMIYGNTLHDSCSLNKILQFNKEHGGKQPFPLRGECAIGDCWVLSPGPQHYFVLIVLADQEEWKAVHV